MDFYSSILHIHITLTDIIQVKFLKLTYKTSTFENTWLVCQKKKKVRKYYSEAELLQFTPSFCITICLLEVSSLHRSALSAKWEAVQIAFYQ